MRFEKLDDLIYVFAQARAAGQPVSLNWAEGIVFIHAILPPATDELVEEFLKGRVYYIGISFALMENYDKFVTYKSPQGEISVPILNVSSNSNHRELARWLKTQQ